MNFQSRRLVILLLLAASVGLLIPGLFQPVITIRGVLKPEGVAFIAPQMLEKGLSEDTMGALKTMMNPAMVALLKRLAEKGGVVGIYMMPFLRAQGQPTSDDFVRHVAHCVNVCGEDHVGVGSDCSITPLDLTPEFRKVHADFVEARRKAGISAPGEDATIFNYVPDFNTPRRMEQVGDALAKGGHGSARIEKILGANWMRLLRDVWKGQEG